MIILGIDPGTATTGFGVIQKLKRDTYQILDFGVISTDKSLPTSERLLILQTDLKEILGKYNPTISGVEKLFFTTNQKTALKVSEARGVVIAELERQKIQILEFTPLQVKSKICGYGKASKEQVQFMIKKIFKLQSTPKPDDAADALAVALCAAYEANLPG